MSSPGVGVVGSSLGGGLSWYARAVRLAVQRDHRRRAGARRRHIRPRDRDQGQRPAVGGPRRRRRIRGRHRAGVRPDPGAHGVRRDAGLGLDRTPSACSTAWGGWAADGAGDGDQRAAAVPGARSAVAAGRRARPQSRDRRRGRASADPEAAAGCSRRCGRCARRSTPSTSAPQRRVARSAAGSRGADRGLRQQRPARRAARTTPWTRWSRRPAQGRGRSCCSSSCASSAARCHGRRRAAVRWTGSTARSWCSASGLNQGAGWAAVREDADRVPDALQPWATESAYLSMADADVDERAGWPASSWQRLARDSGRGRPSRAVSLASSRCAGRAEDARLKTAASSSQGAGSTVVLHHHTEAPEES